MKIQYLGHSCFRIISQLNTAVLCDPYCGKMVGFAMPQLSCDVVTISHHHQDHDCVDEVKGTPAVLEGEVNIAADDIAICSKETFHDDKQGKLRGKNMVFCFLVDGLRVVHMGDVGVFDEGIANFAEGCDVLLLPVGGVYTVDAKQANKYVQQIRPKIVVPMHYKTPLHNFEIDTVDKFLALQQPNNITFAPNETLVLEDAPKQGTQIVVLQPYVEQLN